MKKLFICLIFIFVFLFSSISYSATEVPQNVLDLRESVVRIYADYEEEYSMGTGFVIGDGSDIYFVTNNHVVEGNPSYIAINYNDDAMAEAKIVFSSEDYDLCVLKSKQYIPNLKPLNLYAADVNSLVGKVVYAIGYPGAADDIFDAQGASVQDVSITDGIISAVKKTYTGTGKVSINALQMNASISEGNSGGPLVLPDGQVVGVNTFTTMEVTNINGAIAVSELIWLLENNNIPYKSSFPITATILIIVCIPAVLAVVIIIFLLKRAKKKKLTDKNEKSLLSKQKNDLSIQISEYFGQKNRDFDEVVYTLLPVMQELRAKETSNDEYLFDKHSIKVSPQGRGFISSESLGKKKSMWVYEIGTLFFMGLCQKNVPEVLERVNDDSFVANEISNMSISPNKKQLLSNILSIDKTKRIESISYLMDVLNIGKIPLISNEKITDASKKTKIKEKTKISKKKKIIICVGSAFIVLLATFITLHAVNIYNYTQAVNWIANHEFKIAYQILRKVPQYVSPESAQLGELAYAGTFYEDGNYKEAQKRFEALGDFSIAKQMAEESLNEQKKEKEYTSAITLMNEGKYFQAMDIFIKLDNYSDANIYELQCYEKIIEMAFSDESPANAYKQLVKYEDNEAIALLMEELIPDIYDEGVAALNSSNDNALYRARTCFELTKNYKDSDNLLEIIKNVFYADSVFDLLKYSDTYAAINKEMHKSTMITEYIGTSTWQGDGYYFKIDADGQSHYNLPVVYSTSKYYTIANNIYYIGDTPCYSFEIVNKNVMNIYAYENGRTYKMIRN